MSPYRNLPAPLAGQHAARGRSDLFEDVQLQPGHVLVLVLRRRPGLPGRARRRGRSRARATPRKRPPSAGHSKPSNVAAPTTLPRLSFAASRTVAKSTVKGPKLTSPRPRTGDRRPSTLDRSGALTYRHMPAAWRTVREFTDIKYEHFEASPRSPSIGPRCATPPARDHLRAQEAFARARRPTIGVILFTGGAKRVLLGRRPERARRGG